MTILRKKIQDLIKGIYEYDRPELKFSESSLRFEVLEDDIYKGRFTMVSSNEEKIRGLILCDHPRMKCMQSKFDAVSVDVDFEYHAKDRKEGCEDQGTIIIVSSSGEYQLPFTAVPVKHYYQSSIGKIKTINDFSNLAKLNWDEALTIFQSRYFGNIFADDKTRLLYEGLCYRGGASSHEMEEFLIGTGKKSRNQFEIEDPVRDLGKLKESFSEEIQIEKSGWGYIDIQINTESAFIELDKIRLLPADFTGKRAKVMYSVLTENMHSGKNYGEIIFRTALGEKRVQICAQRAGEPKPDAASAARKYNQRSMYVLASKYIEYRLGRIDPDVWSRGTIEVLDKMMERDPADIWNFLLKCHVLIMTGQKSEADGMLEDAIVQCKKKNTPMWCYVQFLELRFEDEWDDKEKSKQNKDILRREIREVSRKYPGHLILALLELALMEDTPEAIQDKYETVKYLLLTQSVSPILYMEAYLMIKKHPSLLKGMDGAEFRIFYWAAKHKLLTDKMISVIVAAASREKSFHNRFLWLLGRCYKITRSDAAIRAVCIYLIKNNRYGEMYLTWFSRGIEKRMRIAGLCEAYIQSWHKTDGDIPWRVLQYFSKKTELPAVYKARIYAYAVRNRDRIGKEWNAYERLIPGFVAEELKKNHMSDDLAELCRYLKECKPEELHADILVKCIFSNKVICSGYNFSGAVVCEDTEGKNSASPFSQGAAYVHIRSRTHQILFEDSFGKRYFLSEGYRINRMIPGNYLNENETVTGEAQQKMEQQAETDQEEMLTALCGSVAHLSDRIREVKKAGKDVHSLQEQLLVRMLFTENFSEDHVEYFREICKQNGTEQLRDAYVSYFSWRYVYADETVPEEIFEYLEYSIQKHRDINACGKLAMLKWYCQNGESGQEESAGTSGGGYFFDGMFSKLLEQNLAKGYYFPFYESLPMEWKRKYFLHDCRYLEISYKPGIKMHCSLQEDSRGKKTRTERIVQEVFPGLYVLPIRLFAGELLEYAFYEKEDNILKSGTARLTPREIATAEESRYQALNQALEEAVERTEKLKKYAEMTDMVNCLFKPL